MQKLYVEELCHLHWLTCVVANIIGCDKEPFEYHCQHFFLLSVYEDVFFGL
jgi:hypothetical protein